MNEKNGYAAPAQPRPAKGRLTGLRLLSLLVLPLFALAALSQLYSYPCSSLSWPWHEPEVPLASMTVEERVHRILSTTPLIDGHDDFAILIRYLYNNHIYDDAFRTAFESTGLPQHVDLPRLRAGMNGGAFWSVYVSCPKNGSDFSDANYAESVRDTLQQIDVVNRLKAAYPDVFSPAVNGSTALAAFRRGQLISPLGVEGLHQIGNSVATLRQYHALGVHYATLTHNCHNRFADAALLEGDELRRAEPLWGGLSPDGRRLVREMNRLGMLVDLSHTSVDTMEDVLGARPDPDDGWAGSRAPVIFSHSSAYAVCPHPRNVPDHVLDLVREHRGVVMVNFAPGFVSCRWDDASRNGIPSFYAANNTLAHVATHIMHIGARIGYAHVGLGSDYDGIPSTPAGLEDVAAFPALVAELLRRGVSDADAALVVGGSLLRVWAEADAVALQMQAEGVAPMEDDLPTLKFEEK